MNKLLCSFLTLVLSIALGSAQTLQASTLHLILIADTADENIGSSVRRDLFHLATAFRNISYAAGMKLKLKQVSGYDLTAKNVGRAVMDTDPKPDDAVVFFYSGHGFRTPSSKTPWPSIALMNDKGMELNAIFRTLEIKKPRLVLVIGDCCNNTIRDGLIDIVSVRTSRPENAQERACRKLFAEARGAILASSSKPGEYSIGLPDRGGVFTIPFLRSLFAELYTNDPNWRRIMSRACRPIRVSEKHVQHPQFGLAGAIAGAPASVASTSQQTQPSPPPKPQTSPQPYFGQTSSAALTISVAGISNVASLKVAHGGLDRGEYDLTGIQKKRTFAISGRNQIRLDISGIKNTVVVPMALKDRIKYSISGIDNRIKYER